MHENEVSFYIRKAIFKVYNGIGPGLFESVYLKVLAYELNQLGLKTAIEVPLPLIYESIKFEAGFRIDLLVEDSVIVEVKSVEQLADIHHKQILTYLRLSGLKLGILINFNVVDLETGIVRKVNNL
jgi:GxxExxY protein